MGWRLGQSLNLSNIYIVVIQPKQALRLYFCVLQSNIVQVSLVNILFNKKTPPLFLDYK